MKYKKIAIAGFAASMLVGAGTGLVLNIPGGASAASGSGAAISVTTPDDGATDATATNTATDAGHPGRGMGLDNALADLVTTGTITQEQSDAITAALEAKRAEVQAAAEASGVRPERGAAVDAVFTDLVTAGTITQEQADAITTAFEANRPLGGPGGGQGMGDHGGFGGHGGHGHGGPGGGQMLETAATALGITADELKTELEAGKTVAEVATANGVDVQTVIDALVAERTADITQRVTDFVNGVKPADAPDDAPDDVPADSETTATTTG